jgi:hypothetical protein
MLIFNFNMNVREEMGAGIATGYGIDDRLVGVRVPVGSRIFFYVVQTVSGAHPASYPMGTGDREADDLPPTSPEFKQMWIYTSTSPYAFNA